MTWSVQWTFNDSLLAVWDNGTVAIDNQDNGSSLMSSLSFMTSPGNISMVMSNLSSLPAASVDCRIVAGSSYLPSNVETISVISPGEVLLML